VTATAGESTTASSRPAVSGLSRAVIALLGLTIADDLWSVIALLHRASLMSKFDANNFSVTLDTIRSADHQVQASAAVSLLLLLLTGIVFIVWLHRMVKTLHELQRGPLRFSPGWAIGAWFVPFLNLVRPKQIVDDSYRASNPAGAPPSSVPIYFHFWWAAWLIGNVISSIGGRLPTGTPSELVSSDRTVAVGDVIDVVAATLAIMVVLAIARRVAALPPAPVYVTNYVFNPPPGWPVPPAGWTPPAGWQPDPSWPPAPAGWNYWLPRPS
jgi:hypothetical protein